MGITDDRADISALLTDYTRGIDARDFDLVRTVFADDATLDYSSPGGPIGTPDEVIGWLRDMLAAVTVTQHLLTNLWIRLDGDSATARAELLNPLLIAGDGAAELHLLGGSYDDRLRRTSHGWRITHRVHTTAWSAGPLPARLTVPQA